MNVLAFDTCLGAGVQPRTRRLAVMAAVLAQIHPEHPLHLRPPDVRPQEAAALARVPA
jgi:hypothetical protein